MVMSVIFIAVVIVINMIVSTIPSKYSEIDISSQKLYSIGDETKKMLKDLEKDVTIYQIAQSGSEDENISNLLKKYEDESKHIKVEQKDPVVNPKFVSQYTSDDYNQRLTELHIRHSYSRKGCPYDNAPMESFHASLKKECVYPVPVFEDYETAAAVLFEYVHAFYNRKRIHSSLGYQTPLQVEIATLTSQMAAWFNAFQGSNKLLIAINDLFELWKVNAVLNVS